MYVCMLIEERLSFTEPEKQCFHLCIVNLVIGTLYCAKGNFEFGISRIIKSLDPYDKKLHTDTWYGRAFVLCMYVVVVLFKFQYSCVCMYVCR